MPCNLYINKKIACDNQRFLFIDAWLSITKLPGGEAMIPLIDSFVDLLNGINTELAHLTEVVRHSLRSQELFSYLFSDSFRGVYDRCVYFDV